MTNALKIIKIAEARGMKYIGQDVNGWPVVYDPKQDLQIKCHNYFYDLNAMHEAEKVLRPPHQKTWDIWEDYCRRLEDDPHATAAQRAEAFGKTLNLW